MIKDYFEQSQSKQESEPRQVAFDSSEATKQRIAALITLLHESSYFIPCDNWGNTDPRYIYIRTLKRLFVEARSKLTQNEKEKCEDYLRQLGQLRTKWKNELYPKNRPKTQSYYDCWTDVLGTAEEFETYLMELLDKHGFLMKDKPKKIKPH